MKPFSRWTLVAAICTGLLFSTFSGPAIAALLRTLDAQALLPWRAQLASTTDLLVMAALVCAALRATPRLMPAWSGLLAPFAPALRWALLSLAPAWVIAAALMPWADWRPSELFWNAMVFPFAEEWLYRGLAMGALLRFAGWHWWQAALLPAAAFGVVHLGQGQGVMDALGVVTLTGVGGMLFGWLFVRWNVNLWPPVLLHAGLNATWLVFALGENALGGQAANVLRIGTVLWALLLCRWMAPARLAAR